MYSCVMICHVIMFGLSTIFLACKYINSETSICNMHYINAGTCVHLCAIILYGIGYSNCFMRLRKWKYSRPCHPLRYSRPYHPLRYSRPNHPLKYSRPNHSLRSLLKVQYWFAGLKYLKKFLMWQVLRPYYYLKIMRFLQESFLQMLTVRFIQK